MKNPIKNFRQSSNVFEKPGILSGNLKTLTSSKYPTAQNVWWNFAHVYYLPMSTKGCVWSFLFYLDFKLFAATKKDLISTHSFFTLLLITQDLNKIKLYGSWRSSKFSIVQKKTWFLKNNRGLL